MTLLLRGWGKNMAQEELHRCLQEVKTFLTVHNPANTAAEQAKEEEGKKESSSSVIEGGKEERRDISRRWEYICWDGDAYRIDSFTWIIRQLIQESYQSTTNNNSNDEGFLSSMKFIAFRKSTELKELQEDLCGPQNEGGGDDIAPQDNMDSSIKSSDNNSPFLVPKEDIDVITDGGTTVSLPNKKVTLCGFPPHEIGGDNSSSASLPSSFVDLSFDGLKFLKTKMNIGWVTILAVGGGEVTNREVQLLRQHSASLNHVGPRCHSTVPHNHSSPSSVVRFPKVYYHRLCTTWRYKNKLLWLNHQNRKLCENLTMTPQRGGVEDPEEIEWSSMEGDGEIFMHDDDDDGGMETSGESSQQINPQRDVQSSSGPSSFIVAQEQEGENDRRLQEEEHANEKAPPAIISTEKQSSHQSVAPPGVLFPSSIEELRQRIGSMYQHYCPEKLCYFPTAMTKYKGMEWALLSAMVAKYGPEQQFHGGRSTHPLLTVLRYSGLDSWKDSAFFTPGEKSQRGGEKTPRDSSILKQEPLPLVVPHSFILQSAAKEAPSTLREEQQLADQLDVIQSANYELRKQVALLKHDTEKLKGEHAEEEGRKGENPDYNVPLMLKEGDPTNSSSSAVALFVQQADGEQQLQRLRQEVKEKQFFLHSLKARVLHKKQLVENQVAQLEVMFPDLLEEENQKAGNPKYFSEEDRLHYQRFGSFEPATRSLQKHASVLAGRLKDAKDALRGDRLFQNENLGTSISPMAENFLCRLSAAASIPEILKTAEEQRKRGLQHGNMDGHNSDGTNSFITMLKDKDASLTSIVQSQERCVEQLRKKVQELKINIKQKEDNYLVEMEGKKRLRDQLEVTRKEMKKDVDQSYELLQQVYNSNRKF